MDPVTKEIATRYLKQIEQLGPEKPELLDAALHGTEIIIILCDGRKLRFDLPVRERTQTVVSEPFAYIEEAVEIETPKPKRRTKK